MTRVLNGEALQATEVGAPASAGVDFRGLLQAATSQPLIDEKSAAARKYAEAVPQTHDAPS